MEQQTLFQDLNIQPPPSRKSVESARAKRFRLADKAAKKAGKEFCEKFQDFFLTYLAEHGQATTEEIRGAYVKTGLPCPHDWKASGSIVSSLSRKGIIKSLKTVTSPTRRAKIDLFALANRK